MNLFHSRSLVLVAAAFLSSGCGKQEPVAEEKAGTASAASPMEIRLTPALQKMITLGQPKNAPVAGSLRVAGRVAADETRLALVNSPVTGRIIELEVTEGQNVRRGQVLALIRSTELSDAQLNFLKSYSRQQLAAVAVDRAKHLLEAGVIGTAELQRRESELMQVTAELSSARDQLRVLGMPEDAVDKLESTRTINSLTRIVASIDGTVLQRKATLGQVLQPAETVFVLADLSSVWLIADVPEQTAGNLAVGKEVEAEIAALPGHPLNGKLTFVSSTVNPETRTVRARMNLANPHRRYKPDMLATFTLKDGAERQMVVPATAVVREGDDEFVFVRVAEDRYRMRPVKMGEEFGDLRVITEGLQPGETIVTSGAFHLNNERRKLALQGD